MQWLRLILLIPILFITTQIFGSTPTADSVWQVILEKEPLTRQLEEFHQQVYKLSQQKDTVSLSRLLDYTRAKIDNDEASLGEGAIYFTLGAIAECRGYYEDAISYYGYASDYYANRELPILLFDAVDKQTDLLYMQEDYEREAESWLNTIDLLKNFLSKAPDSEKATLLDLLIPAQYYYANSLHSNFHYEEAYLEFLDLVSTINSSKGDKDRVMLLVLKELVTLDIRFDNYSKAQRRSQQIIELSKMLKDTLNLAVGYMHMGEIHFKFKEIEQGRRYKKQAARLAEAKGDTLSALKRYLLGSDSTELRHNLQRAETYCRNHNLQNQLLTFWYYYGSWMVEYGNIEEGYRYAEKILAHSSLVTQKKLDYSYSWAQNTRLLYWLKNKEYAKVLQSGYPTLTDLQFFKDIPGEIKTHDYLAQAHTALNQSAEAVQHLRAILTLRDTLYERANNKDFIRIQADYEYEQEKQILILQKDQERQLVQAKLNQQRLALAFVTMGLILLLALLLAVYRNYRNRTKAAQILKMQKQQLVHSNQKLDRFAQGVSHDILANLDFILSTGKVLVGRQGKPESLQHFYEATMRSVKQTKQYCQNILLAARQPGNQATTPVDANEVLQAVLSKLSGLIQQYDLSIEYDELPLIPMPTGDLAQIFQNLLHNAISFAGPGGQGNIAIRAITENDHIKIGVLDNGPGIPADQPEAVFEPGVSFRQNGTGTGLATVKAIVESYGGRVWAEQNQWGGAGVWFAVGS